MQQHYLTAKKCRFKSITMAIIHRSQYRRIDVLDERFYTKDNITFYPSVTTVLEALPKGAQYAQWVKDLGHSADEVMRRAGDSGSKVHNAIEGYLRGEELRWMDLGGKGLYSIEEWLMILKFVQFWERYMPDLVACELLVVSVEFRLGGTIDIICRIDGELWIIDVKTSNAVYDSHHLQLGAYATMYRQINKVTGPIRIGIMHLKAMTRGEDKKGKSMQGAGWQLKEIEEPVESLWEDFCHLRAIWDRCNPNYKPKNLTYPDRIQLKEPLKKVA